MSSINGLGGVSPIQQTSTVAKTAPTQDTSAAARPTLSDRLELSGASGFLTTLKAGGGFRADKVADIRSQLASGSYETDAKLDAASDKLLDALRD